MLNPVKPIAVGCVSAVGELDMAHISFSHFLSSNFSKKNGYLIRYM